MPEVPNNLTSLTKGVTDLARDAAYVTVGLGVLSYQRLQVHRTELQNRLAGDERFGGVREGVAKSVRQIDGLAESATQFVETTLQPLEERFPDQVTQLTSKAREQARELRSQIRQRVSA